MSSSKSSNKTTENVYCKKYYQIMRKSLMSDAQFRRKNLAKKLERLLIEEQSWKPFRFDFKCDKKDDSISGGQRDAMVILQGQLSSRLGWSHDTRFTAMHLFDRIIQTSRITTGILRIFSTAVMRLAAKLYEETKLIPPGLALLEMNECNRGTVNDLNKMEWLLLDRLDWYYQRPPVLPMIHMIYALFCTNCSLSSHTLGVPSILEITEDLWVVVCSSRCHEVRPSLLAFSVLVNSVDKSLYQDNLVQLQDLVKATNQEVAEALALIGDIYNSVNHMTSARIRKTPSPQLHKSVRTSILECQKKKIKVMKLPRPRPSDLSNRFKNQPLECILETEEEMLQGSPECYVRRNKRKITERESSEDDIHRVSHHQREKTSKVSKTKEIVETEEIYKDIHHLYNSTDYVLSSEFPASRLLSNNSVPITAIPIASETIKINCLPIQNRSYPITKSPKKSINEKLSESLPDKVGSNTSKFNKKKFKAKDAIKSPFRTTLKIPCKIQLISQNKFVEDLLSDGLSDDQEDLEQNEEGKMYLNDVTMKTIKNDGANKEGKFVKKRTLHQVYLPSSPDFPYITAAGIRGGSSFTGDQGSGYRPLTYAQVLQLHLSPLRCSV